MFKLFGKKAEPEPKVIGIIRTLDLKPSDVILLQYDKIMNEEFYEHLRVLMRAEFPEHKILILEDGMKLALIRDFKEESEQRLNSKGKPMRRLDKDEIQLKPGLEGWVIASLYEDNGWIHWDKFLLADLPNDLISLDDMKRFGIEPLSADRVYGKTVGSD